jgi:hypothetical protein
MKKNTLYFLLCMLPLFFLNLNSTHNWGDDFAQYIHQAQYFANDSAYQHWHFEANPLDHEYAPPSYPNGFPLLMSPIMAIWGFSVKPILILITTLLLAWLWVIFKFLQRHTNSTIALCITMLCAYHHYIVDFKQFILSDIPCALFCSIYLYQRTKEQTSKQSIVLASVALGMAFVIRSQAIVFLGAEGLFFLSQWLKQKRTFEFVPALKNMVYVIIACLLFYFLSNFVGPRNTHSALAFYKQLYTQTEHSWSYIVLNNIEYLGTLLPSFFSGWAFDPHLQIAYTIIGTALLGVSLLGFYRSWRATVLDWGFICMLLLVLVTPVHQGLRYLFPMWLPMLYYQLRGFQQLKKSFSFSFLNKKTAIITCVLFIVMQYDTIEGATHNNDMGWSPYAKNDQQALQFIKTTVPDSSLILFSKPRALSLYTGKRTCLLAEKSTLTENYTYFKTNNTYYVLVRKELTSNFYTNYINQYRGHIDSIQINNFFTLYHLY